jgi:hypothetical protein
MRKVLLLIFLPLFGIGQTKVNLPTGTQYIGATGIGVIIHNSAAITKTNPSSGLQLIRSNAGNTAFEWFTPTWLSASDTANLPYYRHITSVNDTTITVNRPSSKDTIVFRSSVSYVSLSRFINSSVTGTNANITASAGVAYYLPAATLTTNKSITIPAGVDMDYIEIYNLEAGYLWTLAGASVYLSDGVTALTYLNANTNYQIRFIGSKWRISN